MTAITLPFIFMTLLSLPYRHNRKLFDGCKKTVCDFECHTKVAKKKEVK